LKQALITELAESDMAKIWAYIANDKPDVADRFNYSTNEPTMDGTASAILMWSVCNPY
jgi:hypothetical protein